MGPNTQNKRRATPWSIRVVVGLSLMGSFWYLWGKQPFRSDAQKVCRVAELSGCPASDRSLLMDDCKIEWLERTLWDFGSLAKPRGQAEPDGLALRRWAGERGLATCTEADAVDREDDLAKLCESHFVLDCMPGHASGCRADQLRTPWGREQLKRLIDASSFEKRGQLLRGLATARPYCPGATQLAEAEPPEEEKPANQPEAAQGTSAGHSPRGVIRIEPPYLDGEIDRSEISKAIRTNLGKFQDCYDSALKRKKTAQGRIQLHWTITPKGKVKGMEIQDDDVGDPRFLQCLRATIAQMPLPVPADGGKASVGLVFLFRSPSSLEREGSP